MSRGLSQFLRRNVSGEQSLKPVVHSYYSHAGETISNTGAEFVSDSVTEWLTPEPTNSKVERTPNQHSETSPAATSNNSLSQRIDKNIETGFHREVDSLQLPTSPDIPASPDKVMSHSIKSSKTDVQLTSDEQDSSNVERRGITDNQPTNSTNVEAPSSDFSHPESNNMTLAELRDLEQASHSVVPETQQRSAKRRDFTKQVAASILGNESDSTRTDNKLSASPVESALSAASEGSPQGHLEVSVTIGHVSIVPTPKAAEKKVPSWKPPVSLTDYLRERQEGKR
ncbi:hypothetical protein K6Q96_19525 [Grimontia kaedaensis]|uniref:Uncharacterized protein n=1 Tax=Grimontia kaedaensis TaxID=2872157 RepID=A0ABY4X2G2_9GAMM|nr:hypothetical protein [Grimontia kaedaensis]USH05396.1 hypothetical protein K6Q96_19525 [Grimontia kaedaensis]